MRPGLLLYGIVPPPLAAADLDLRPALSLTQPYRGGEGHARRAKAPATACAGRADAPRTIAIVPAGYADGLDTRARRPRRACSSAAAACRSSGSVCMDMIMIDVTGLDVSPGDEVVLIGRQGDDEITAREIAAAIGTIPWEVVCRLGSRIERQYRRELKLRTSKPELRTEAGIDIATQAERVPGSGALSNRPRSGRRPVVRIVEEGAAWIADATLVVETAEPVRHLASFFERDRELCREIAPSTRTSPPRDSRRLKFLHGALGARNAAGQSVICAGAR